MSAVQTTPAVRNLSELAAAMPYMLGYRAIQSIAIVCVVDRLVVGTARCDLGLSRDHVGTVLDALSARGFQPTAFVLLGFEDRAGQSTASLELVSEVLAHAHPTAAIETARILDGHCYEGDDAVGVPLPAETPTIAALVVSGADPLANREAVEDLYTPAPNSEPAPGHETPLTPAQIRAAMTVWATIASAGEGPVVSSLSGDEVMLAARLIGPGQGVAHRDAVIAALCGIEEGGGEPGFVAQVRGALGAPVPSAGLMFRLAELVRRVPESECVPVLTAAGAVAWHVGRGTHASAALERALALDPEYRLARLLEAVVGLGVRPPS